MNESYNDMYKYVSRKTFFASLLMVCAFCLLCTLTVLFSENKPVEADTNSLPGEYVYASAKINAYMLRNSDGRVAVCDYYDGSIIEVLDLYVNTLPEEDRSALENGIYITSIAELVSTLKAYTS